MGWLLALLLLPIAVLSTVFVVLFWHEKVVLAGQLQAKDERLAVLEEDAKAKVAIQADRDRLAAGNAALSQQISILDAEAKGKAALQVERDKLAAAYVALRKRFQGVLDAEAERVRVVAESRQVAEKFNAQLAEAKTRFAISKEALATEIADLESKLEPLRREHRELSEEVALSEMGYYKPHFGFATSERYKKAISENDARQKAILAAKEAATCSRAWTVDGSAEKGRKQTDKYLALMLRAFNGECDGAIAKVKPTNFDTMENRIRKAFAAINKLGEMHFCEISSSYLDVKIEELRLEHEHALKLQAEREEQRAIKEEMRQQALAQREIERAQQEAEREEQQYEAALAKAREDFERASAAKQEEMRARVAELEQMVAEAHANKERAISRAQQTRAGHVYVISNLGSFGANVYKIGMTRRLDPMDRIWELSDASVPFDFDVHAIIYTEDAPGLETELHQRFADRRLNVVNERKEFFHVTIDEIAAIVRERCGDIELTLVAEAAEYLQSEAFRRENGKPLLVNRVFGHLLDQR